MAATDRLYFTHFQKQGTSNPGTHSEEWRHMAESMGVTAPVHVPVGACYHAEMHMIMLDSIWPYESAVTLTEHMLTYEHV